MSAMRLLIASLRLQDAFSDLTFTMGKTLFGFYCPRENVFVYCMGLISDTKT